MEQSLIDPYVGKVVCGTGHRPPKLGGYSDEVWDHTCQVVIAFLKLLRPKGVISGMALGFDQALAWSAMQLDIPFIACMIGVTLILRSIPFPGGSIFARRIGRPVDTGHGDLP